MLAILLGKKKPSESEPGSALDYIKKKMGKGTSDEDMEDPDMEDPVDLFLEAIGVTPSGEARRAFKLAVQSCQGEDEGDELA